MNYRFTKTIESDPGMPFDVEASEVDDSSLWLAVNGALNDPRVVSIHVVKIRGEDEPADG